jgi:hypothetical protein
MRDGESKGRPALDGVRVIDLTWLQIGPQATRLLATFGIRVDWSVGEGLLAIRALIPKPVLGRAPGSRAWQRGA